MANLVRISKKGAYLLFDLDDGSVVQYNLSNNTSIGKRGGLVQGLSSQLSGIQLVDTKDLFEDKGYYDFLHFISGKNPRVFTLSGALKRVKMYSGYEAYCRLGLKISSEKTIPSVAAVPKAMLRWFIDYTAYNRVVAPYLTIEKVDLWERHNGIFQSFLSVRNEENKHVIDAAITHVLTTQDYYRDTITYGKTRTNYESKIPRLVRHYSYDSLALIRYLINLYEYEGIDVRTAVNELFDYARLQELMCNEKFDKYPRCLLTTHRIAVRNYERLKETYDADAFANTYDTRLETTIGNHVFICPTHPDQVKDEAVQQQHCVASYIPRVIEGACHIVFMRHKTDQDRSLITLEVRGDKIIQRRGHLNRYPTGNEASVIEKYEQHLSKVYSVA